MSAVEAFLDHLRVERQVSAHTLDAYRRDLTALTQWAAQTQDGTPVEALQADQLRAFIAAGHRQGLAPTSLQRRLSACRSFYLWLLKHGRIAASPVAGLRAPKAPRKLPKVLDADEAVRLVEVPTDAPLGLRDRALLELFYSSGLRLSELCALRWSDLDLAAGVVTVLGKGRKQRIVPVGSHARNALAAWREEKPAQDAAPVFPGRGGGTISQRAVQLRIQQLAQRQGCSSTCIRTCCGTASPAISSNPPATCAACRNCSAMPTSPPRRSIRTWTSSTWPRSTTARIRAPSARSDPARPADSGTRCAA